MDIKALHRQMAQYNAWKQQLDRRLEAFTCWSDKHKLVTRDALRSLERARALLKGEHFTLACVGEFSRGKTELINALLYVDGQPRLLPSEAGRTTMCPTEIFFDPAQPANCVRLLPIETRRSAASLQSFKRIPQNWFTMAFDGNDPDSMAEAISQVSASKQVSRAEAIKLGFNAADLEPDADTGLVQVPTWRHALINLKHPLLQEGLRIVDTPGLNALGNEPELTLKTLPDAQAILFILAADSGVSASDMEIWRNHIAGLRDDNCTAVLALLNKIDTLWDELTPPGQVAANIEAVRIQTARQLQLAPEHVLPLSAKQALVAKTCKRSSALLRSNFPQLEQRLAECIIRSQQQIIGHRVVSNSLEMVVSTYNSLSRRIDESEQELRTLHTTDDHELEQVLNKQREKIRVSHHRYHKQALSLRTSQRMLDNQRTSLLAPIAPANFKRIIEETNQSLEQSWTTVGLSRAISGFFDDVDTSINHLLREIERANQVMTSIYERPEYGLDSSSLASQHQLNITRQRRQLRNLQQNADSFRRSLNSVLTSKKVLIKRFVGTLVKEVKNLFDGLNQSIDHWLAEALTPLTHHNQYQKQLLEHHMLRLGELRSKSHTRSEQLHTLEASLKQLNLARTDLAPLFTEITTTPRQVIPESADIVSLQSAREAQTI
ncbi:dynamin family protein [Gilvimarinus polysaccharolyticus]|uniref:dynamin family protein n=1 Tax=Gilvimarinus polysaccharolyticus TaxID=863921 RepID=UPI0006735E5F|nr:dynamin family protein [Gilvimarinus polysaccharolyticus]